jgi:hypothetical protein
MWALLTTELEIEGVGREKWEKERGEVEEKMEGKWEPEGGETEGGKVLGKETTDCTDFISQCI